MTKIDSDPSSEYMPKKIEDRINTRHQRMIAVVETDFINWMKEYGKDPSRGRGLSQSTTENTIKRWYQIIGFLWDMENEITITPQQDQLDMIVIALRDDKVTQTTGEEYTESSKRKFLDVLKKWNEYRHHEYGAGEWESPIEYRDGSPKNPSDPITKREQKKIYNASLTYQSPPNYSNLSPTERERWKRKIAEICGKPIENVSPDDFEKLQKNWKIPAIVGLGIDGAARPALIKRVDEEWVDRERGVINVPRDLAPKKDENTKVVLRQRSTVAISEWMEQRDAKEKYDDTDALFLNREGNRYTSRNLNYLLHSLLDEAGIDPGGRKLTWYSLRKFTAEVAHQSGDAVTAAAVLRTSVENVDNYSGPRVEQIRETLENMED